MYPDFDDYYEPSEFEQQVEEFKDSLRRSVKQETQELIDRLRKENEELRSVRDNWEEVKRSYEKKQRELQNEIYTCKQNASRMRLEQLFEECGMNVILYSPYSYSVYIFGMTSHIHTLLYCLCPMEICNEHIYHHRTYHI